MVEKESDIWFRYGQSQEITHELGINKLIG